MSARFEELDWKPTPLGTISLRRRRDPVTGQDIFEVKLDDDFLMSSQFVVAEVELARLALAELAGDDLDVVVGGLGLGYTAATVLEDDRVRSLRVVDAIGEVIDWHERELLPTSPVMTRDPRCAFVNASFFDLFGTATPGPELAADVFDAIVLDIDHSPRHLLHPSNASLYSPEGTRLLLDRLHPGGVFALWSNDPPDAAYLATLGEVFTEVRADVVSFPNPLQGRDSTNTVYLGIAPSE